MKDYLKELKIIFSIIPKKLRKRMQFMLSMYSISGFLESLTIGLFIPIIAIITEKKINFPFLNNFYDVSKIEKNEIIFLIIGLILIVYLIKSIFLTYLEFGIQKLINDIRVELVCILFKKYINSPYKFHLKNNSSILLRNLTVEIVGFCHGIIAPILILAKEFFIITFIVILLFLFDYKISIFTFLFGIILIFSIKKILRKILYTLGLKGMNYRGEANKIILESFQGIKFIKSYKLEDNFINRLLKNLQITATVKAKETAIQSVPRIWIELLVLITLSLLGLYFYIFNISMSVYVSFITLFLIAMIKMLPSFMSAIRIINGYQAYKASIDFIKKELDEITDYKEFQNEETINNKIEFNKELVIDNISFKYDGQKKNIIENLSLKINQKSELIGIFGDSGVGKTTLIDILIGLHNPNKGKFYLDGNLVEQNLIRGKVFGYVPQFIYLFDDTIKNNILISNNKKISEEYYNEILEQCDLLEFINSLPEGSNTFIGENGAQISGGQRQRIGLARALINDAKILILDEATSALDKRTEDNIFDTLKKISLKKSILIITHNRNLLNYCDKIYCLKDGNFKQEK
jgi:ABC-type multidrug transport system fused ATPase/permease subunit